MWGLSEWWVGRVCAVGASTATCVVSAPQRGVRRGHVYAWGALRGSGGGELFCRPASILCLRQGAQLPLVRVDPALRGSAGNLFRSNI